MNEEVEGHDDTASVTILEANLAKWLRLHCVSFDGLLEVDDLLSSFESIKGRVQLVLTDPPFNIRRMRGDEDSDYDRLSTEQMGHFVSVVDMLLRPGGHAVIFCSLAQFSEWETKFSGYVKENNADAVFQVSKVPLILVSHQSSFGGNPFRRSSSLLSGAQYAIHLKKNGLPFREEEKMVNYRCYNFVASTFQGYRNIINNVRGLLPGEQLRVPNPKRDKKNGCPTKALRAEQKPVSLMKELVSRFSQKGDIVFDPFGGKFSTGMACAALEGPREFVGGEASVSCFQVARGHLYRRLAELISKKTISMGTSPFVRSVASKLFSHSPLKNMDDVLWHPPGKLPTYQKFPEVTMRCAASFLGDVTVMQESIRPIDKWDNHLQGAFQGIDVDQFRVAEAAAYGLVIAATKIQHPNAGLGVYACRSFSPGDVICPYYGTLVYADLGKRGTIGKEYGTGILGVTAVRFQKFAAQVQTNGPDFNSVKTLVDGKKSIFLVAPPFCATSYINDYRYSQRDVEFAASRENSLHKRRIANVELRSKTSTVNNSNELLDPQLMRIIAIERVYPGDELYLDYGPNPQFIVDDQTTNETNE